MSFVSIILTHNFLSVMADSRGVQIYTDGRFHKILDENMNKINVLSPFSFISFTGMEDASLKYIASSDLEKSILLDGKLRKNEEIHLWHDENKHLLREALVTEFGKLGACRAEISFGGFDINNQLKVYYFGNDDLVLREMVCKETELKYSFSSPAYSEKGLAETVFKQLYHLYDGTLGSMIRVQEKLNDIMADNDVSVNKNVKLWFMAR